MGSTNRNTKLSLMDELEQFGKSFSLESACFILEHNSSVSFGKEISISQSPFYVQNLVCFHLRGSEIDKVEKNNQKYVIHTQRLSLAGINAPIPTPYSELIFRRRLEKDFAMSSFINTFNARLVGISYQISKKRYIALQKHNKQNCEFVRTISTFSGTNQYIMQRRLAKLSYLFWSKEKSATGLRTLIESVTELDVRIDELKTFWIKRNEIKSLGNMMLGVDSDLGCRFSASNCGFAINVTSANYEDLLKLIMNEDSITELKDLIEKYIGVLYKYIIVIKPKKTPPLKMGEGILGRTSWFSSSDPDPLQII